MSTLTKPPRQTEIIHDCDPRVIGGSCTGVFASARAARLGPRSCSSSAAGRLGGVATWSMVDVWHSPLDTIHQEPIIGGLTVERMDRLPARGAVIDREKSKASRRCCTCRPKLRLMRHLVLAFFVGLICVSGCTSHQAAAVQEPKMPLVRIAELEIDPAQLGVYTAAVREEIEASVRTEPGVLAIYCVAEKENPSRLRFFEIYTDDDAYRSHIASPHFQKYAAITKEMILSKKLIDTDPIELGRK